MLLFFTFHQSLSNAISFHFFIEFPAILFLHRFYLGKQFVTIIDGFHFFICHIINSLFCQVCVPWLLITCQLKLRCVTMAGTAKTMLLLQTVSVRWENSQWSPQWPSPVKQTDYKIAKKQEEKNVNWCCCDRQLPIGSILTQLCNCKQWNAAADVVVWPK